MIPRNFNEMQSPQCLENLGPDCTFILNRFNYAIIQFCSNFKLFIKHNFSLIFILDKITEFVTLTKMEINCDTKQSMFYFLRGITLY